MGAVKKDPTIVAESSPGEPQGTPLEKVATLSDVSMMADVQEHKYVRLTSPSGAVTEVPEGIVDALVESGYSKKK
jgi:hypothetical protein